MPDGFEAIVRQFRDRCAQDLIAVQAAIDAPPTAETEGLRTVAHRLAGLAATFGYAELGDLARAVDLALIEGRHPSRDQLAALATALAQIS